MDSKPVITLKPREEDRLMRGHPWVYDNEIAAADGAPVPGGEVLLKSARGKFLGSALWSPASKIRARRYSRLDEPFDRSYVVKRLREALACRLRHRNLEIDSMRAVFAEADGLPGLIVDRFVGSHGSERGSWLSVQLLSRGVDERRADILLALDEVFAPDGIMERSDAPVRALEGLAPRSGVAAGSVPDSVVIRENGLDFAAHIGSGQKTGWFLDQRENRAAAASYAHGRSVLDVFCNQGGFSLACAASGASAVLAVDSSADALASVEENASLNGLQAVVRAKEANAFDFLREEEKSGRRYGLVVLDPPAFAKNKASLEGAVRGYKEINLRALKLLEPGGVLATFSCSFWLSRERFLDVLDSAAADAGLTLRYLEELRQAPDHPVISGYAESRYLKGCIVEVVGPR
ncbi:MAG: class I SAM-dependent rRNA methyltransferase [Spirochaetales bacterium]|nr:class I SAM-dependent rRNA methyltransferase [Spirochaetales bacterium]